MLTSVGSGYETKLSVPAPDLGICYGGGGGGGGGGVSPEGRQCMKSCFNRGEVQSASGYILYDNWGGEGGGGGGGQSAS